SVIWASSSFYNSLQLRLDKRMSRGFQFQTSFTWGRSLDNSSASFAGDTFQNSLATIPRYDMSLSRGLSDFDIRRALVINALWNAPSPKSLGTLGNRLLGGWQFGTISTLSDGVPFSIVAASDDPGGAHEPGGDQLRGIVCSACRQNPCDANTRAGHSVCAKSNLVTHSPPPRPPRRECVLVSHTSHNCE